MKKILKKKFLTPLILGITIFQGTGVMSQKIAIIGTGYVGLVSGAGLAQVGHSVICADISQKKINQLCEGVMPIYEPGLQELVKNNVELSRLTFTCDVGAAIEKSDIIFIAVGTPMNSDGSADLTYIKQAAMAIAQHINGYKVIVTKSTVPIGFGKRIKKIISSAKENNFEFDIVSNPEFLREGSAVGDFLMPDRIVVGCESERAKQAMAAIYEPFAKKGMPIVYTNLETSETIKYASNACLAMKVAYINEISRLCDATGADVLTVARAMGMDQRIGKYFLQPGPGFGGSCFPKDVHALSKMSDDLHVDLQLVHATLESNEAQKQFVVDKIEAMLSDDAAGKTVSILGLAFKANTDDIRDSASIFVIEKLLEKGATINGYDPQATENMKQIFPEINYFSSPYDAVKNSDIVVILTEWAQIKNMDLQKVASLMKQPVLLDMRNIISPEQLEKFKFNFSCFAASSYSVSGELQI